METIKEEKKADLKQLLNSLIEKGWKPFGKRNKLYAVEDGIYILGRIASDWNNYDLRQIVSKESGLWQFVCQKKLATARDGDWLRKQHHVRYKYADDTEEDLLHATTDFLNDYRLIESSLKDESELEDFLLSNVKVDE